MRAKEKEEKEIKEKKKEGKKEKERKLVKGSDPYALIKERMNKMTTFEVGNSEVRA